MRNKAWYVGMSGLLLWGFTGCQTEKKSEPPAKSQAPVNEPAASAQPTAKPVNKVAAETPKPTNQVVIETSQGRIVLELTPDKTPITVENFLRYVDAKHYDGTIFHRVIQGFMIQGGGLGSNFVEKPTQSPIKNESPQGMKNKRGTISMARKGEPDSATAQFYINLVDNVALDYPSNNGYCAFGTVIEGMDVVDRIAAVPVAPSQISEAQPLSNVEIVSIRRK